VRGTYRVWRLPGGGAIHRPPTRVALLCKGKGLGQHAITTWRAGVACCPAHPSRVIPSAKGATVADPSEYKATFELVDIDGDGFISPAEFQQLMRAFGQEISHARAVEIVVEADRSRDGLISLQEFADYLAANPV
jgi:hypothetical protein